LTLKLGCRFTLGAVDGLRVSELAERAGIAPSTVRFYERAGLLSPARRAPRHTGARSPQTGTRRPVKAEPASRAGMLRHGSCYQARAAEQAALHHRRAPREATEILRLPHQVQRITCLTVVPASSLGRPSALWPESAQDQPRAAGVRRGPVRLTGSAATRCSWRVTTGVRGAAGDWPEQLLGGPVILCVPKTSSTSCDQAVFIDRATGAGLPSDAVPAEIDRLG
jgi:hypothetical protein